MNRRHLIALLGGAMTAPPSVACAQQKAMPVIGFLTLNPINPNGRFIAAFREGLAESGYSDGQNVAIEYRSADGHYDRLPALAVELVNHKVDVIATTQGTPSALAAKGATSTIPVVFIHVDDPIGRGLVASLARPGGNVTGLAPLADDLIQKRLELIAEMVPQVRTIALLINPGNPLSASYQTRKLEEAAHGRLLKIHVLNASTEQEIDSAFTALAGLQAGALVVGSDAFFSSRLQQLVALAARDLAPTIYEQREFVMAGGLISYGAQPRASFRGLGAKVGRILNGANPADLPVEQPTTFELVINIKTAKALGLTVPQALLARADEVIE